MKKTKISSRISLNGLDVRVTRNLRPTHDDGLLAIPSLDEQRDENDAEMISLTCKQPTNVRWLL